MPDKKLRKGDSSPASKNSKPSEKESTKRNRKKHWLPDSAVVKCMQCDAPFTKLVRRHHCRKCGSIICKKCSPHTLALPDKDYDNPVRICIGCYQDFNKGNTDSYMMELLRSFRRRRQKRWWYGFYRLFTIDPNSVVIGELWIKILGASHLPAVDLFRADPYIQGELGNQKFKTKVIYNQLNPTWNKCFVVKVTNALSTLKLKIWDYEHIGADHFMGEVNIPLWVLSSQKEIRRIFDINVAPGVRHSSDLEHVPQIVLELQYTFSKTGEFFSYFTPETEPFEEEEFSIDKFQREITRIYTFFMPLINFFIEIGFVVMWKRPYVSGFILIILWFLYFNPWLSPVLFQLILIRYMCLQYLTSQVKKDTAYAEAHDEERKIQHKKKK